MFSLTFAERLHRHLKAIKAPWLGPGGPILALATWTGLENPTFTLYRVHFWQGRLYTRTLSGCLTSERAKYCMLITEWAWLQSQVCLLRLEVDLDSVLESELGQRWRYGALKVGLSTLKINFTSTAHLYPHSFTLPMVTCTVQKV